MGKRKFESGDKIITLKGDSPYYIEGAIGRLIKSCREGSWYADFTLKENKKFYGDGKWYINKKNFKLLVEVEK